MSVCTVERKCIFKSPCGDCTKKKVCVCVCGVKRKPSPDWKVCPWASLCPLSFTALSPLRTQSLLPEGPLRCKKNPQQINFDCFLCASAFSEITVKSRHSSSLRRVPRVKICPLHKRRFQMERRSSGEMAVAFLSRGSGSEFLFRRYSDAGRWK